MTPMPEEMQPKMTLPPTHILEENLVIVQLEMYFINTSEALLMPSNEIYFNTTMLATTIQAHLMHRTSKFSGNWVSVVLGFPATQWLMINCHQFNFYCTHFLPFQHWVFSTDQARFIS